MRQYEYETFIKAGLLGTLLFITLSMRFFRIDYNAPSIDESFYQVVGGHLLYGDTSHASIITGSIYLWPLISFLAHYIGGPLAPRIITALLGTATVIIVYFLGKQLWIQWNSDNNQRKAHVAGVLSAILFSTAPSSIWISRTATYDALANFFLALGILFLVLQRKKQETNFYFWSAFFVLLSMATSYSVMIYFPFIIGYSIIGASNHQERLHVLRKFIVPLLFLFITFHILNYPFVLEGIKNVNRVLEDVPHEIIGFFGVLKEILNSLKSMVIITIVAFAFFFFQRRKFFEKCHSIDFLFRKRNIMFYLFGACSVLFYYLSQGHIRSMERKLSMFVLFISPLIAFVLTHLSSKLFITRTRFQILFPLFSVLLMCILYLPATPKVRQHEQNYVNLDPVIEVLKQEVIPKLSEDSMIACTSYDNVWYLKQQIEGNSNHSIRIDETSPWWDNWLNRLKTEWRPDVLVGILTNRYHSQEEQANEEQKALITAYQFGYRLHTIIPTQDSLFGEGKVYILLHEFPDEIYLSNKRERIFSIAYSPTGLDPIKRIYPSEKSIRRDLSLLRNEGFRGLVTYGANNILGRIPEIARSEGFDAQIIMGIWDPFSSEEWDNAISQSQYVDGYCLGNEGLEKRYTKQLLAAKMKQLRIVTRKPVTTSERIIEYFNSENRSWLFENSDFIFPTVHSYWAKINQPKEAVAWALPMYDALVALTDKEVVFKEVGLPTDGDQYCNEKTQAEYYSLLERTHIDFVYFEAYDQPWKLYPSVESHWGLHGSDRTPKLVMKKREIYKRK